MRIGLYSLYWSTMGGGEKYMLDIAKCFPEDEIIFIGDNKNLIEDAKNRFGFFHKNVNVITDYKKENERIDKNKLKNIDLFFYQCDGSIFIPFGKKNILLIQSPVHSPVGSFTDKIKLLFWQKIVCNSRFTANFVKRKTGINPVVLNPCVEKITKLQKENIILSVGRFFPHLHSKKQEVLIDVFKRFHTLPCHSRESGNPESYRLILAGSVSNSDQEYLSQLKKQSIDYPIEFHENISFEEIKKLYGQAKIFWHAAGFGEDLKKYPERAEHFGISTVEAISAGCYPLVFKAGGQVEILGNNEEFYWQTKEELIFKTLDIINTNYKLLTTDYQLLNLIPERYIFENFKKKLYEIIK